MTQKRTKKDQGCVGYLAPDGQASIAVLEPLHFLNLLGYCKMKDTANALLLAASVSSKVIFPTTQRRVTKRK